MINLILWLTVIITCITGWNYGFGLTAILSLIVGIQYENFVYNELLACKSKEIRSYRVADVHLHKIYLLGALIVILILITVMVILGFIVNFPVWVKYVAYIIIIIFVFACTYTFPAYLALSKYERYLKRFLSKDEDEWDSEDIAFCERLNKQQMQYNQLIDDKQFRKALEKYLSGK